VAGVSQAAVSRAFTPGASISKATQDKVVGAAKTLGYRPNLLARSLIMGQSGIVGVVLGDTRNPYFISALDALSARFSKARKQMLVFTAVGAAYADLHVEDLLRYRVDALLLMATALSSKLAEQCRDVGVPVVYFARRPQRTNGFVSVTGNNKEGARQIAAHLLQQGYRRPAFMAGLPESSTSRERETAFTAYLTSEGVPKPEVEVGNYNREGATLAMRRLLMRDPRPDSIFCANDYMAMAALEVARYEFGLKIGSEIGIAGFGDTAGASWRSFDLTTYSQPVEEMIEAVTDILLSVPVRTKPAHTVVDGVLVPRGSTRR
jgi:DNA-binding LacI/PurR family transcriptional regulator